jgi:hypothetical protein
MPPAIAWLAGVGVGAGEAPDGRNPFWMEGLGERRSSVWSRRWGAVPTEHPTDGTTSTAAGGLAPTDSCCSEWRTWRGEPPSHGSDETAHPWDLRPYTSADPASDDQGLQRDMLSLLVTRTRQRILYQTIT